MNMNIKFVLCLTFCVLTYSLSYSKDLSEIEYDAVHKNDSWSQNQLGIAYENGSGVEKNLKMAFSWFQKAAANNNKYACFNLARYYHYGLSVNKDIHKAISMYEKAASLYNPHASLLLGKWYLKGENVHKNHAKAAKYFKDAAFGGLPEGKYYFGYCYAYGHGVEQDSIKSLIWLNRALNDKFYTAYYLLGKMYKDGICVNVNKDKAFEMFQEGDYHNDEKSSYYLAFCHLDGIGISPDTIRAVNQFISCAHNGTKAAMISLGNIYSSDKFKFKDLKFAAEWYEKAAKLNDEYSFNKLLNVYKDLNDDKSLYDISKRGYNLKFKLCMRSLSLCYAKGTSIDVNYKKSLELIDDAIKVFPDDPLLYDTKGEILWLKGNKKEAKKMWEYVLSNYPVFYKENESFLNKMMLSQNKF